MTLTGLYLYTFSKAIVLLVHFSILSAVTGMPDFSYHPRTFRTVVRILLSSTFLTRVSNVAIKLVGLRREHMARLLKRTNAKDNHDDQAAAADDDDDADDGAVPTTMTTTQSPKRQ